MNIIVLKGMYGLNLIVFVLFQRSPGGIIYSLVSSILLYKILSTVNKDLLKFDYGINWTGIGQGD